MKRLLLPTITLAVCLAIAHAGPVASTWEHFKAAVAAGDSVRSQAVDMGDGTYTVINRSLGAVCDGDCLAADGGTAPGDATVVTDGVRLWRAGAWGACSNTCGSGTQTRTATCVDAQGESAFGCDEDAKPTTSQSCMDASMCAYAWQTDEWSTCAGACGQTGVQTRAVTCADVDGQTVDDANCNWEKPAIEQACVALASCTYAWVQGGFGVCSTTCGTGTQSQSVSCRRSDGTTAVEGMCAGAGVKPAATQPCISTSRCISCKKIKSADPSAGDGAYTIYPDGVGFSAYCDMTSAGGGWTMVAAQYENYPVAWAGNTVNYDSSLGNGRGWALPSSHLPSDRTETGFGKDKAATFVGYAAFVYVNGNINKTTVVDIPSGQNFHIGRNTGGSWNNNDPDDSYVATCHTGGNSWCNTLTYDRTGIFGKNWAFSPLNGTPAKRGCSMGGSLVNTTGQSYAWTVWVR